jgi:hypothetical protein
MMPRYDRITVSNCSASGSSIEKPGTQGLDPCAGKPPDQGFQRPTGQQLDKFFHHEHAEQKDAQPGQKFPSVKQWSSSFGF